MSVWILTPDKRLSSAEVKTIDDVSTFFDFQSDRARSQWIRFCSMWTRVHTDEGGISTFMGYQNRQRSDINVLATRILVDQNQFRIASFLDPDNPLSYCVRGDVLFYRVPNVTKESVEQGADTNALLVYSIERFQHHWINFFRDGDLPYIWMEKRLFTQSSPLKAWISIMRGDLSLLKQLAGTIGERNITAGTRERISGVLIAIVLRRMDARSWDKKEYCFNSIE